MSEHFKSYQAIKQWKDEHILKYRLFNQSLNCFHDKVMEHVFSVAFERLNLKEPPCDFTWFLTGSGGRYEQGLISDQDHGIVYETENNESKEYFIKLGNELSYGLYCVGYPYCDGKVMPSNPLWCQSVNSWKRQLNIWLEDESWEAIRYLQIFLDARAIHGNAHFLIHLKREIYIYQSNNPVLLQRFLENIMHIKNAIGPLGQFLVEEKGEYQGMIDLKHAAFIPYVNAIRLLAFSEELFETSTSARIDCLVKEKGFPDELLKYKVNLTKLLDYRNNSFDVEDSYEDLHYLDIQKINKDKRRELKHLVKDGKKLHQYVRRIIEKRVLNDGI